MILNRRGTSLVELLVALGIATGLFATMATVEFVARRATFEQIATLDALDALERISSHLHRDLAGDGRRRSTVPGGEIVLRLRSIDPEAPEESIEYRLGPKRGLRRQTSDHVDLLGRHVASLRIENAGGDVGPPRLAYALAFERTLPHGRIFRRSYEGSILPAPEIHR